MFVSNTKSTKEDIVQGLKSESQPKKVYHSNVRAAAEKLGADFQELEPVVAARNTKQVRNIKHQETLKGRLTQCELFSIYYMGLTEYGKMILDVKLLPTEYCIIGDPAAINFAKQLLQESRKNPNLEQLISYDTIFDSYVSTVVMRNIYLQGSPIFPVAFMIHSEKHKKAHKAMWETMEEQLKLSKFADSTVYTMDRETAFAKQLRKVVPEASIVFCHNHILTDV
jgi:hypothetical protein